MKQAKQAAAFPLWPNRPRGGRRGGAAARSCFWPLAPASTCPTACAGLGLTAAEVAPASKQSGEGSLTPCFPGRVLGQLQFHRERLPQPSLVETRLVLRSRPAGREPSSEPGEAGVPARPPCWKESSSESTAVTAAAFMSLDYLLQTQLSQSRFPNLPFTSLRGGTPAGHVQRVGIE